MVDALNGRRFDPKMCGPQTNVPNKIVNEPFGTFCIIPNKGITNDAPNSGVVIPLLSHNDPIIFL
jgi:hypothetical protein